MIEKVDFGRDDAESDDRILDYFVETGTTRSVALGKQLVLGRKGSGKTALFRHLAAELSGRVVELDLDNYVFSAHHGLVQAGLPDRTAYTVSWRLLISAALYAESKKDLGRWDRFQGRRALQRIGRSQSAGPFGAIIDWLSRVQKLELPSVAGVADLGGIELSPTNRAWVDTSVLRSLDVLESLNAKARTKRRVSVLIDRLDDAWDGSGQSLYLIAGAVRAARHYGSSAPSDEAAPVVVFLRSDLWERLDFNDKNKMGQDTVSLTWTDSELDDVVDRRIHATAGTAPGHGWTSVFTSDEMRQRASVRTYVIKRAMGRPRDVIAFVRLALESAREHGNTKIETSDIYAAEARYSRHVVDELRDELALHLEDFPAVVSALKALRKRRFSHALWAAATRNHGLEEKSEEILDSLFESSVVGIPVAGGAGGGSRIIYRYQDRHLKFDSTREMEVHPAFRKELGLKDR